MRETLNGYTFGGFGSAQFHGLLYAEGSLYASKQVSVLGALVVNGRPQAGSIQRGGVTLRPGDVRLEDGSQFVYVRSMFNSGNPGLALGGILTMKSWNDH